MANTQGGNYISEEFERFCQWLLVADYPPSMTVSQLADALGLSRDTVASWVARGYLDTYQEPQGRRTVHILLT